MRDLRAAPARVVAQAAVRIVDRDAIVERARRGQVLELVLVEIGERPHEVVGDLGRGERRQELRDLVGERARVAAAAVLEQIAQRVGGERLVGIIGDDAPQRGPRGDGLA